MATSKSSLDNITQYDTAPVHIPEYYTHFTLAEMRKIFSTGKEEGSSKNLSFIQYPLYLSRGVYRDLSLYARFLYAYIKNFSTSEYGGCIQTNDEIAASLKWPSSTVRRNIQELTKAEVISVQKIPFVEKYAGNRKKGGATRSVQKRLLTAIVPKFYNPKKQEGPDINYKFIAIYHTAISNIQDDMPYIDLAGIIFLNLITAYSFGRMGKGYVDGFSVQDYANMIGISLRTMQKTITDLKNWGIIDTERVYLKSGRSQTIYVNDEKKNFLKVTPKVDIMSDRIFF